MTIEEYLLTIAIAVASRSKCRRQVGCVLADKRGMILATGYNGLPSGWPNCTIEACLNLPGSIGKCNVIHAEQNALIQCTKPEAIHYVACTRLPCVTCGLMLCNTPGRILIYKEENSYPETLELLRTNYEMSSVS